MKIQIEESLFLENDGVQFILKKYSGKIDKQGNETFKTLGYFGSLKAAVKKIVTMKLMQSEAETLQELLSDLQRVEKEIDALIKV